ncbi:M90 family metallopeptidase [Dokdonella soli]|uniref:Zinc-dependent peptidase n=1 Tax=Dokdonella soli TaxID=529810 RepID=A0ABN1IGI6_9GAMM
MTAFLNWLARLRHSFAPAPRIGDGDWQAMLAASALFECLSAQERALLRELTSRFLARKTFSAAGGHELTEQQCLAIATLACLPVLHLGFDWLAGWREVIVYPGEFRVKREHHDERSGVVTEGEDDLIGEAWERGPLILSWTDVATDLEHPFDGFNVVAHEIAHKLDMLDGAMNGVPRLPAHITRRDWIAAMQPAYDALLRAVERGRDTLIDPYAAESVEEYFAVVSELHFSDPTMLHGAAPAVSALLERFYGPPDSPGNTSV